MCKLCDCSWWGYGNCMTYRASFVSEGVTVVTKFQWKKCSFLVEVNIIQYNTIQYNTKPLFKHNVI